MHAPLMIRLELEQMKYSVVHALMLHEKEIQAEVDQALEQTLKSFDFAAVVRETVERELRDAIKKAVARAASSICWSDGVRWSTADVGIRRGGEGTDSDRKVTGNAR